MSDANPSVSRPSAPPRRLRDPAAPAAAAPALAPRAARAARAARRRRMPPSMRSTSCYALGSGDFERNFQRVAASAHGPRAARRATVAARGALRSRGAGAHAGGEPRPRLSRVPRAQRLRAGRPARAPAPRRRRAGSGRGHAAARSAARAGSAIAASSPTISSTCSPTTAPTTSARRRCSPSRSRSSAARAQALLTAGRRARMRARARLALSRATTSAPGSAGAARLPLVALPWEELLPLRLDSVRRLAGVVDADEAHPEGILRGHIVTRAAPASARVSRARSKPDRQVADAAVLVAARPLDRAVELELAPARQQLLEDEADLRAREARAEAMVQAVAEGEVRIRLARDVEAEGIGEDRPRRGSPTDTSASACRRRGSSARPSSVSRVAVRRL